jgi:hypothetical protein
MSRNPRRRHKQRVNASAGADTAIIAVSWDRRAENLQFTDGAGNLFYDGAVDLDGYRVFRGIDKRGVWVTCS